MPISHTCPSCAHELARIRAIPDSIYALPIVTCPRCAHTCVRTKHPDLIFWRGFRRSLGAIRRIIAVSGIVLFITLLTVGIAFLGSDIAMGPARFDPTEYTATLITTAILAAFLLFFTAALRTLCAHTTLWRTILVLSLIAALGTYVDLAFRFPYTLLDALTGSDIARRIDPIDPENIGLRVFGLVGSIGIITITTALVSILSANRPPLPKRRIKRIRTKLNKRFAQD